jgi:hypothetical protein
MLYRERSRFWQKLVPDICYCNFQSFALELDKHDKEMGEGEERLMAKNKPKKASQKDLSKMRTNQLNKIREWAKAYPGDQEQLVRDLSATFNMSVPKAIKELETVGAVLDPELVDILMNEVNVKVKSDPNEKLRHDRANYLRTQKEKLASSRRDDQQVGLDFSGMSLYDIRNIYSSEYYYEVKSVPTLYLETRFDLPIKTLEFHELSAEHKVVAFNLLNDIIAENLKKNASPSSRDREQLLDKLCNALFGELDNPLSTSIEEMEYERWEAKFIESYKMGNGALWVKPFVHVLPDDELKGLIDARVKSYCAEVLDVDNDELDYFTYE